MGRMTTGGRNNPRVVSSARMVDLIEPYRDDSGAVLQSRAEILRRLHPGDILVWDHQRPGNETIIGHVQTVEAVQSGSAPQQLTVVEGDQPIGAREAEQIADDNPGTDSGHLRSSPGRRVQRSTVPLDQASTGRWTFEVQREGTHRYLLVAAGPPRGAQRPEQTRTAGASAADWNSRIAAAQSRDELLGRVESALQELRAQIEGGDDPAAHAAEARALGQAAGGAARRLEPQHSGLVAEVRDIIAAFAGRDPDLYGGGAGGSGSNTPNPRRDQVAEAMDTVSTAYDQAAAP